MSSKSSHVSIASLVTTHQNADLDALAGAVAACRLYPGSRIVFPGAMNRNVRDFVSLHYEDLPILGLNRLDMESVERLIVVDTDDGSRLGELQTLWNRDDVEVIVFDHHQDEEDEAKFGEGGKWVPSSDGSQATSMLHILLERGMTVSPMEATIFALGIHEDTGSLTYPRTSVRDAEMLAACMRLGASHTLIEKYLHNPLSPEQKELMLQVVDCVRVEDIRGQSVHVAAVASSEYVDGLSVIAHKVMDLLNCEVFIQAVDMESRVFVAARSRAGSVDVGALLKAAGGGGHPEAASAIVRDRSPEGTLQQLLDELTGDFAGAPTAADIMSRPVRFLDADTSVSDALLAAQRYGHSGISVSSEGLLVGIVARRDLDKAVHHGLSHAPVKGVMSRRIVVASERTPVEELRRTMADAGVGRVPIVREGIPEGTVEDGAVSTENVVGMVTRTDVLEPYLEGGLAADSSTEKGPVGAQVQALEEVPYFGPIFRAASTLSEDFSGAYLVGGFVRDLLLDTPNADVDIAVEGDGIDFAQRLGEEFGGRVRPHKKFRTAVVLIPWETLGERPSWPGLRSDDLRVDVATARTEFYDYPAALPSVEHASIRQDLFRRDFTINAMAVSLKGNGFGEVLDFFGGLDDLNNGVIRVLHNLSFIEDPTRIFRAVRYENRYDFRMDAQTLALAGACVDMHLVGDLSSARLRDELIALLSEHDVDWTLRRLSELGAAQQVHPRLATGKGTRELIKKLDELVDDLTMEDEVTRWRLRLAAVTRRMAGHELYLWLEKLRLRRLDGEVIRKSVVMGPKLGEQLSLGAVKVWDTYEVLSRIDLEVVLFAAAITEDEQAHSRLVEYLAELRHRRLEVTGEDIIALGVEEGPEVGRILDELRKIRVQGDVRGRTEELEAARSLIGDRS